MNAKLPLFLRASLPFFALALPFVLSPAPANADTTDWETSEGGRMRVVSQPADASGRIEAVLQIELKPGWITYWREPGEAGIPPKITLDPTSGATLTSLAFPVPKLIENGEINDIGYDAPVSLPFVLQAQPGSDEDKARLTAFIGVCLNICIPFEANFEIRKDHGKPATPEETEAVANAKVALPQPPDDDFKVQNFHITPDKTLLGVELRLPDNAPKETEIYVAGPSGYAYFEPQNMVRDKRKLSFYMNIKGLPKSYNPRGQHWTILVKSGGEVMEAPLDFPQ
ncbi:protein-disulfide reductase DsbD domain-containing protein [Agrobacterium sp. lyk4-40-TYG-31]|uniref:protein-disulfide reductase DsbD domain-containing protein n=1 Tax=Agrobacterium sp. lyk4-40-TYG-31 TaxID=3040276 RepID=UPI00254AA180|nr:protein-disulfide reductase DsbD domain-containing protein [Agrobacterium sp. lyk4-40-TYG-31]